MCVCVGVRRSGQALPAGLEKEAILPAMASAVSINWIKNIEG